MTAESGARATDHQLFPRASNNRRAALGLGLGLAIYGNIWALADHFTQLSLGGTIGGALLGVGSVLLARRQGRGVIGRLGLGRAGLRRSLVVGLLLGLGLGLPGAVYFLRPDLAPVPVRFSAVQELDWAGLFLLTVGKGFFTVALAEELAFRGLLQAQLREAFGRGGSVIVGAGMFTAWHVIVNATTLAAADLDLSGTSLLLPYSGQLLAVLAAGLAWGMLREWSGNLYGCVLSHWLANCLMLSALYWAP